MNRNRSITAAPLLALACLLPTVARAATPAAGTLSATSTEVTWSGGPLPSTQAAGCGSPSSSTCDHFQLTIVPPSFAFAVEITLTPTAADDWDLQVWGPAGNVAGSSGEPPALPESVTLNNPEGGVYTVSASPYLVSFSYSASARLIEGPPPLPVAPASGERPPTFAVHLPAGDLGQDAGEPTLGVNFESGKVMYISSLETLRVSFDDCSSPAEATWEDVSFLTTSLETFDPILWTDQELGRTFVSQLLPSKISLMAFSDDDGENWTPSQGAGINSGVDHQGLGGGPFTPGGLQPITDYQHSLYYCSQDIALAYCALSLDGGLTFGPAVPIYNLTECSGLHGHPKVAPDGTAYVPNKDCGEQAVVVSENNGLTWSVRRVPGTSGGAWDPSAAIGAEGRLYFGFGNGDGLPYVAVSSDRGLTWDSVYDVGSAYGIKNIAFPAMIAGDDDRAAFAFLGTAATGDVFGDDPTLPAAWYLYVAFTYDGGESWVTVNATPGDPVQRGTICNGGTLGCGNGTRNLLDFNDLTVDAAGRVLASYADGCTGACVQGPPNSGGRPARIARQVSGKRLFAAADVLGVSAAPLVDAVLVGGGARLSWAEPDDHGATITSYRVYRRTATTAHALLATLAGSARSYTDTTIANGETYYYQVTAVNAHGEGPACREAVPSAPAPEPDPRAHCTVPGVQVASDAAGDYALGGSRQHDIRSLAVAEPYFEDGAQKLALTMTVDDLSSLPANSVWRVSWVSPNGTTYFVDLDTTDPITGPQCGYGFLDGSIFRSQGTADGCQHGADGRITVTVTTDKVGGPVAGQALGGVSGRSDLLVGILGTGALARMDAAGPGSYVMSGNASCAPAPPGNQPPVAVDDAATTRENKPVQIAVLGNDSDPDGDALAVASITGASHGTVIAKKNGTASYKPDHGFTGTDSFTYTVTDGQGNSDTATVTVTVLEH